uniref:Uncharacterized protein n=1 Tax=Oryza sativa subsp. japonica TaxID=39947 RepID=Q6K8B9_ORYSJ|nr:hypothetical protein [Oryza sativa Japonica Group]BAD21710.1 hypothetical protein [Oryza sativa Japonica Group]
MDWPVELLFKPTVRRIGGGEKTRGTVAASIGAASIPPTVHQPLQRASAALGSSKSLQSDASYTATAEDDIQAVARALIIIAAKFHEAILQLVRRLTPARVASSLDWDLLDS